MPADFLSSLKSRRSYYSISRQSNIPNEKIEELLSQALKYVPSAFNSQSNRAVLLFGASNDKFWDTVKNVLAKIVPAEHFAPTDKKINSFKASQGTVLYFYDKKIVESLQAQFPTYKDNFPRWAEHSNAMLQFAVWNLLENEGLGASLQHYNPIIDESVRKAFDISENFEFMAQMPFGKIEAQEPPKQFNDIKTMMKIFY